MYCVTLHTFTIPSADPLAHGVFNPHKALWHRCVTQPLIYRWEAEAPEGWETSQEATVSGWWSRALNPGPPWPKSYSVNHSPLLPHSLQHVLHAAHVAVHVCMSYSFSLNIILILQLHVFTGEIIKYREEKEKEKEGRKGRKGKEGEGKKGRRKEGKKERLSLIHI